MKHGGDRKSDQVANFATRFTAETVEKLGLSERAIRLSIVRHQNIAPDIRVQIAATWLANKGTELDALSVVWLTEWIKSPNWRLDL